MKVEDCKTLLDYWLFNIVNMDKMKTTMPFIEKDPALKHMSDISYYFSMPYLEQQSYFHEIDAKITYKNMIAKKMDKMRAVATAEGHAEGERQKAIEIARNLKNAGIDLPSHRPKHRSFRNRNLQSLTPPTQNKAVLLCGFVFLT